MNTIYAFKRSPRARRMRITVHRTGEVIVTVPRVFPMFLARKYARSKEGWIQKKVAEFRARAILPTSMFVGNGTRREYLANKKIAYALVLEKIKNLNIRYNYSYTKINIRNQKTRWGSCSKKGSLSFNYRIVFLPTELQDYLIVHELCHIKEFNHSKDFWNLVAKEIPNYKGLRRKLKGVDK